MPKLVAKHVLHWLATLCVAPLLLSFWVSAQLVGRDRAMFSASQAISLVPGLLGQYLRRAFYCRTLASCHPTVAIEFGSLFSQAGARLGENVYIGPMCHLGLVDIGKDALIASGVHIPSGPITHGSEDVTRPIREQPGQPRMVRIGAGSWLGSAAIVLADVGRDSIVAAGAVVTKPIPDRVVAAGVPAKVVKNRE